MDALEKLYLGLYGAGDTAGASLDNERRKEGRKEGNILFNDTLNTFSFTVIWRETYG